MASLALASRGDYSHLRAAASSGDVHFIRAFLRDRDAFDLALCVDDAEDDGCTALWHASARGHADAVAELIAHGASTEKARHGGATPLIVASRRGHLGAVRALVDARADLGATCPGEGRAPLHLAADGGHEAVCEVLLAAGADPTAEDAKGMTPCMVAAHRGDAAVLRCLVHHDKVHHGGIEARFDARHNFRTAALLLAAKDGDAAGVRALLSAGADSRRAASCLHAALCGGELASARVVEVLAANGAAAGANVDGATAVRTTTHHDTAVGGETSLHFAARTGSKGVTRALLDAAPIDVDAADATGRTPLHVAATHGHASCVEALLAAGADANARETTNKRTALHCAARAGHLDCVRALCERTSGESGKKIDVNAGDDHWGTPLHAAVGEGHVAVVDWLLSRAGADVDAANRDMCTPLHESVRWADARTTAILLGAGASPAKRTKRGLTPLHVAVAGFGSSSRASAAAASALSIHGYVDDRSSSAAVSADTKRILRLRRGGQVEDGDWYDLRADQARRDDIVDALLAVLPACDVDARCFEGGSTPLYLAARWGHAGWLKKLIDAGADVDAARERPDPGLGGSVVGPGGPTPLQAARAMGHRECVAVLLEHGAAEAA